MFMDRFLGSSSSRMSSIVFPRLQRERRRRADAEQEVDKWRHRAEQLEVADEARARAVLDDARHDFAKAGHERKSAAADREAAILERQRAEEMLEAAEQLMKRARRAGRWAVERTVQVASQKETLQKRERAIRDEEESHEQKRLGIFPKTPITPGDTHAARSEVGIVPDAANICVIGAPRSGKSSLINALRGLEPDDPLAAPVLGSRSPECARPRRFHDAKAPGLVYHEVPEGRTLDVTGWEYYVSKSLYAYDVLVLVHNDSPSELETRIAQIAHRRGQPCLHVRTKADEHIRNTRRTSKLSVSDARETYMARVRDEATRRREQSSTIEALRPARDREYVVSEMGLHRHVTGAEKDPDEVYGTGEEDEARFISTLRALVLPPISEEEKEVAEAATPATTDPEESLGPMPDETEDVEMGVDEEAPKLDDLEAEIANAEEALRPEGHKDVETDGGSRGGPQEETKYVEDESRSTTQQPPKYAETPFETPLETFSRLSIVGNGPPRAPENAVTPVLAHNGHAAAETGDILGKHPATVEDVPENHAKAEDIQDDEVFGSCGERI